MLADIGDSQSLQRSFSTLICLPPNTQVLADIGDSQSLQQSLSTFSGHVKRLQQVLEAATPSSLVLLDELGSGTDPSEGAALAVALLRSLEGRAALSVVTSHFAEVKVLAETTEGFTNASVEFDAETLQPTYKVLWGVAGSSNAISIADRLGVDPSILAMARRVLEDELANGGLAGSGDLMGSLAAQLE